MGGVCGLVIYGLMGWFCLIRITKMNNKEKPVMTEVTQPLDLLASDVPEFNLAENKFEYGYSIVGKR